MKIYGPYIRKDGRQHIVIVDDYNNKTSMSYPKFLLQQHLQKELSSDETVDHINGDYSDNRIENLQILSRSENAKKRYKDNPEDCAKMISFNCPVCGTIAQKKLKDVKSNRKRGSTGPYCSRSCASKSAFMP